MPEARRFIKSFGLKTSEATTLPCFDAGGSIWWQHEEPICRSHCTTLHEASGAQKEKTHKHKQICWIVPGLGGCQKFVLCFFRVIPYGGEKHVNKIPPKIPGQSRENFVYVFFSLCVFSLPIVVRRADSSLIFILETSWSKCKHVFGPKDATMDAHMLSLSTWVWRRLCDVLYAQESGDATGYPPPSRAIGTPQIFPQMVCAFLRDSGTPFFKRQNVEEKSAENLHKKWAQTFAQKSAHQNSAQKTSLNIPFLWKMEARKK